MAPIDSLVDAINSASADRLRKTLLAVLENESGRAIVENELLLPEGTAVNDRGNDSPSVATPSKRKRYETCRQCKEEFDITKNAEDACVWHSGEMEPYFEGDFWADHDEDCHGTIDSEEMRKDFPEGFVWTCCNKDGTAKGCKVTEHTSSVSHVKKYRI